MQDPYDKQEDKVYIPAAEMIAEVKKRTPLYDLKSNVSNKEKLKLWKEVGAAIFDDWRELDKTGMYDRVTHLQRRWRSFRDSFRREMKHRISGVRRTARSYVHFNRLLFLRTPEEGNVLNIKNDDEESEGCEDSIGNYEGYFEEAQAPQLHYQEIPHQPVKSPSPVQSISSSPSPPPMTVQKKPDEEPGDDNSDKLFLLSFLNEMSQLPLHIKMWAKVQIANAMQEAVSKQYAEQKQGVRKPKF